MKVLITGANGLLGQKLVPLVEADPEIEVIASGKGHQRYAGKSRYMPMDITDPEAVSNTLDQLRPQAVVHTAAMTDVDACEQDQETCDLVNVEAVGHLIEACQPHNSHFLHISTDFIFNGDHGPLSETDQPDPVNYYGHAKLKSEELVKASGLPWAIARTVLVYGVVPDMSRSNIVLWAKKNLEEGKEIRVVNDQLRTPTLAEDLAMGCYLIVKNGATGIFNISGKDLLSPYDMVLLTADHYRLDKSLIKEVDSTVFKQPARRPLKTGFHIEKAKRKLGFEPHSFQEGLEIVASQIVSTRE